MIITYLDLFAWISACPCCADVCDGGLGRKAEACNAEAVGVELLFLRPHLGKQPTKAPPADTPRFPGFICPWEYKMCSSLQETFRCYSRNYPSGKGGRENIIVPPPTQPLSTNAVLPELSTSAELHVCGSSTFLVETEFSSLARNPRRCTNVSMIMARAICHVASDGDYIYILVLVCSFSGFD